MCYKNRWQPGQVNTSIEHIMLGIYEAIHVKNVDISEKPRLFECGLILEVALQTFTICYLSDVLEFDS